MVYEFTQGSNAEFLKVQLLHLDNDILPTKVPVQQLARLFVDPFGAQKFDSQKNQQRIQCSLLSMYHQYACSIKIKQLLHAVQKASKRTYIDMHKMTPININRNFFRTNKFEFDSDGKMTKLYIKFLATTDKVGRDFFDNEYSELVDRIITALEKKQPTYEIPEHNVWCAVTKEKKLHEPKYTHINQTLVIDRHSIQGDTIPQNQATNLSSPSDLNSALPLYNLNHGMQNTIEKIIGAQSPDQLPLEDEDSILALTTINNSMTISNKQRQMTKIDPIEVPRLMFNSDAEFKIVKKHYGDLARKGIIVSISGPYFNFLHDQDIGQTRDYVKSMTRHNDKLGFDWNKPQSEYVASVSQQFRESAYPEMINLATIFYGKDNKFANYVQHLKKMAGMYGKQRNEFTNLQTKRLDFGDKFPRKITGLNYDRQPLLVQDVSPSIENYELMRELDDTRVQLHEAQVQNNNAKQLVRGMQQHNYQIPKEMVQIFALETSKIANRVLQQMDDHNPDYPLSVVNPFATLATVPRVPQVNPEPTMAFRMYDELQISLQNNEKLMIFGNHANSRHPLYYFKGTDADPVISALTRDFVAYAALDAQLNKVSYLNSSLTGAEIKAACQYVQSQDLAQYSSKIRIVSGGIKCTKISKSDNESGVVVVSNQPKGFTFATMTHSWADIFERQDKHRLKEYTAGIVGSDVAGAIYRPQDIFDTNGFYDTSTSVYGKSPNEDQDFKWYETPIFFRDIASGAKFQFPQELSDVNSYHIIFNQNLRHSYAWYLTTQNTAQFEFQIPRYFEAIPESEDRVHETRESHLPLKYQDAIHLLRNTTPSEINGTYEEMFQQIMHQHLGQLPIVGIWSETIVPAARDFQRWAAKVADKTGISKFLADNAGDIALMALSTVQPEVAAALKLGLGHIAPPNTTKHTQLSRYIKGPMDSGNYSNQSIPLPLPLSARQQQQSSQIPQFEEEKDDHPVTPIVPISKKNTQQKTTLTDYVSMIDSSANSNTRE